MSSITTFCAVCLIAVVFGGPIENQVNQKIYPEKCTKGQVIWCENFSSAAECDAVNHCIQNVWLNTKRLDDDNSCSSCEKEIDNIRTGISSNSTKEVLKDALEYVCEVSIITRIIRKSCEKFVDSYVDSYFNELLDLLKSEVDSKQICALLGFCTKSPIPTVVNKDDAVVYYKNIVLHLPAQFINVKEATELLGSKKCTLGQSYWCRDLTSSKECQMTSHCIANVWSKADYVEDNDFVCQVCKDMFKQTRDELQSSETQEELKEKMERSCKLIPRKEIQKECIKLTDKFLPEIIEMIVEQLNPTVMCTVAGLCNSARIDNLLADISAPFEGFDSCTNCTIAFTAVERFLKNSPRSDVVEKLLLICNQLSSYSDACSSLVFSNFEGLYTMLKTRLKPFGACHMSGMCASRYHLHPSPDDISFEKKVDTALATANDDVACDLCKQLVTHFKEILIANTTQEEFLEVLQGICEQIGKFKSECSEFVNDYFEIIYKFLTEELNPSAVCRDVNLCSKGDMISDEALNVLFSRIVPQTTKIASLVPTIPRSSTECRFCRMLVQLIENEMKKSDFEKSIEKAIEEVCTLVSSSDKDQCDRFVEKYAGVLIRMLADEADPRIICDMLDLCTEIEVEKSSKIDLCPFCQRILQFIEEQLQDSKVEKDIENIVKNVCKYVPNAERNNCLDFIGNYSSLIISVLAEELDPSLVCPLLKLCPGLLSAEDRCTHCQILMSNLMDQLGEDRNENNIKNKLKGLVDAGRSNNATAIALELAVSHYEDVIDMMTAEFDDVESCSFLKFCDPKKVKPYKRTGNLKSNEIMDTIFTEKEQPKVEKSSCELCELLVQIYEDKLTSNITEHDVEIMFSKYCNKIKWKLNCTRFIDKYFPILFNLLKSEVKPKDLCELAKLCPLRALNSFDIELMQECRFCEVVVGAVQNVSTDPYTKQSATNEKDKICDIIGERDRDMCSMILNSLALQIENIVAEIPSWYYCAKLDMCPYHEHLVDPHVCLKQELWCENLQTAVTCDKLKYCQKNVWKSEKPSLTRV